MGVRLKSKVNQDNGCPTVYVDPGICMYMKSCDEVTAEVDRQDERKCRCEEWGATKVGVLTAMQSIKDDLLARLAGGASFIEVPATNFLQTDRTFTFEMFDKPAAELNV